MTVPDTAPARKPFPGWAIWLAAALIVAGVAYRQCSFLRALLPASERTTITHSLLVDRVQAVAKLVSSETTVRDVVVFQNTVYGSTKRSLVVVTGKILAGFDLEAGADVRIDEKARHISIALPRASILAIEITDLTTYDERRGLWNPFRPADRDAIHRLAREKLRVAAAESGITEHATQSAIRFLETMFSRDGYTTEVSVPVVPVIQKRQ